MSRRTATALLLLAFTFLFQIASLQRDLNVYDEGVVLVAAQRILDGDIPYRDFWHMYAPGQAYTVAALFKLFSTALWVERLWDVLARVIITMMAWVWARKLG